MAIGVLDKVVAHVRRLSVECRTATDCELLARFTREADELAFAELVRRHGPMVLAVCRRVLRHEQDAEDAFQAAFLVLARKADSLRPDGSVSGWLHQVAHRIAMRAKAFSERRRFVPLQFDIAECAMEATNQSLLDDELTRLPEQYRSAIVLCYLEGKSQSEAARLLATTTDAINSRLKRARELLRHRLSLHGWLLSTAALAQTLATQTSNAALSSAAVAQTTQAAIQFTLYPTAAATAFPAATTLANGALHAMIPTNLKLALATLLAFALIIGGLLSMPGLAQDDPMPVVRNVPVGQPAKKPNQQAKAPLRCIILWMTGGPSQLDTFDPKPGNVALFKAIDTNVKGVQFSELLPNLAKQANHLAILRSVTHREGDHMRGMFLMHTGHAPGGVEYPALGCVLAKELGQNARDLPRFVAIDSPGVRTGLLGDKYAPLKVGTQVPFQPPPAAELLPTIPPLEDFAKLDKDQAADMRKNLAKAFDLAEEKAETRGAYGKTRFGNACLLARRMSERGVPVVEISLGSWDTHSNALAETQNVCKQLDAAYASLVKDLHERKSLDQTLIVWMGEFGRTPKINANGGRDHYPLAFSVVLAGAGIKGGQAIGKTSDDGFRVTEQPVTVPELFATIYRSLGVDPHTTNKAATGQAVPLIEKGNDAIKQALR